MKPRSRASRASADPADSRARSTYARIYAAVRLVPYGRVATYGQIARVAGLGQHARMVGYALAALPSTSAVPWHRVINARGMVSPRRSGDSLSQRLRLEKEGVRFDLRGRVALARHRWHPRPTRQAKR